MIIEFFGISGVGKSTICREVYKYNDVKWPRYKLYEKNSWIIRNIKKFFSILFFLIFNVKWVINLNEVLNKYKIENSKDKINLIFNGCSLKTLQNKCKYQTQKYIFDEGVLQYIWAICLRTNNDVNKENVENILSLFEVPSKIFVVKADSNVILERLVARGEKTKIMESENVIKRIEHKKKTLEKILTFSNDYLKNVEIICVDTTEGVKDVKKFRV